jgi:integrase
MATIASDDDVFLQFKEESKKQYKRIWTQFREFAADFNLEAAPPGEEILANFFKWLREEKKMASSTMWTYYSCVNSILKRKYNVKLQEIPRITMLLKSYDTDVKDKATIFEEAKLKMFMVAKMETSYWLVRQAITIVAFFGGLRHQECLDLVVEKMVRDKDGYKIRHYRVKQRTGATESVFLVPEEGGFAASLANYLGTIHEQLHIFTGRAWWTGGVGHTFKKVPMGKNMVAKVPHELAKRFNLANPEEYSFHSYRRTSATAAANGGMTTNQMQTFFGWKNGSMAQEYISTSRPSIVAMANTLGNLPFDLSDPEVEVEVVVGEEPHHPPQAAVTGDTHTKVEEANVDNAQEANTGYEEDFYTMEMEEDGEMYEAAGIPAPATTRQANSVNIAKTIESAISGLPSLKDANVTVKVCIVNTNNGSVNF